jgi:hypothetical protein
MSKGLFHSHPWEETGKFLCKGRWTAVVVLQYDRLLCGAVSQWIIFIWLFTGSFISWTIDLEEPAQH